MYVSHECGSFLFQSPEGRNVFTLCLWISLFLFWAGGEPSEEEESVMSSGWRWAQQQETECQSSTTSEEWRDMQWTFQILITMSAATTAAHTSKHVTGMLDRIESILELELS